jgi:hypothetical protein
MRARSRDGHEELARSHPAGIGRDAGDLHIAAGEGQSGRARELDQPHRTRREGVLHGDWRGTCNDAPRPSLLTAIFTGVLYCRLTQCVRAVAGLFDISAPHQEMLYMKRFALIAAVMLVAACAADDDAAMTDTGAAMTPAPADTAMMSDTTMMHDTTAVTP